MADGENPLGKPVSDAVRYGGGDGSSQARAVVIEGAANSEVGIAAEYAWVARQCGRGWRMKTQALLGPTDGRYFDRLEIEPASGETRTFYFDITGFFGRM